MFGYPHGHETPHMDTYGNSVQNPFIIPLNPGWLMGIPRQLGLWSFPMTIGLEKGIPRSWIIIIRNILDSIIPQLIINQQGFRTLLTSLGSAVVARVPSEGYWPGSTPSRASKRDETGWNHGSSNECLVQWFHRNMYVCIYMYVFKCMYVWMYVCMYACMYVCMYLNVCI